MLKGIVEVVDLNGFDVPTSVVWNMKPTQCIIYPVKVQDEIKAVVVAGVNPCNSLDESYYSFLNLVSSQIGSILTNVLSYENEKKRSEMLAEIDRTKTEFFSKLDIYIHFLIMLCRQHFT